MRPDLLGVSHLAFSVPDVAAAIRFWVEVLGFEPMNDDPAFGFVFHREARIAVVVTDHGRTVLDTFDEHHPGLDHLALAVADRDDLEQWRSRLDAHGVPHSGVVESDGGWHLNLRAPGDFPVELFVIGEAFATSLGLDPAEPAVAGGH
jgi:catechol 2,3-dioxygenase-like lactoylglutathione lyase family enzyme